MMQQHPVTEQFVRTRYTWLAYFMLAYFAYLMAALGPAMPFLTDELNLTYSEAGMHFSAFAAGMVISGFLGDHLAQRQGRAFTFWLGGVGMAAGTILFISARQPLITTSASFFMGLLGALLLQVVQSTLSDIHGARRAVALSESNIAASFLASLAPVFIGGFQHIGIGWRAALAVIIILYAAVSVYARKQPIPEADSTIKGAKTRQTLPARFWIFWAVIFLYVAVEWSVGYWGAEFLNAAAGLSKADASSGMTAFFGAVVIGRFTGSRLLRMTTTRRVLLGSTALALAGFPLFWLGTSGIVSLAGLFLVGLGIANLFPLTLALAVGVAPGNINKASARLSLASGSAILIVPQLLGVVADRTDIRTAYTVAFLLLLSAAITTFFVTRGEK